MNASSPEEGLDLPHNQRERGGTQKPKSKGFHVYLSYFFFEFKALTEIEQREELSGANNETFSLSLGSVDSVDSVEIIKHVEVIQ